MRHLDLRGAIDNVVPLHQDRYRPTWESRQELLLLVFLVEHVYFVVLVVEVSKLKTKQNRTGVSVHEESPELDYLFVFAAYGELG